MNQNPDTIDLDSAIDSDGTAPAIIAALAQQATTPWKLDEGIYGLLDADGSVKIVETIGYRRKREDSERDGPRFVTGTRIVSDVVSLLDVIASGVDDDGYNTLGEGCGQLEVWADLDARKVTAILDGQAGWHQHRVILELRHSSEWADWAKIDNQLLEQTVFAEFVEDHISSIAEPDAGRLLDIAQTLKGHVDTQWKQQKLLANGQTAFVWEERVEAKAGQKGDLAIPNELTLALRPFQGSAPVGVDARFRFRPSAEGIRLGVRLVEREHVLENAFAEIVTAIDEGIPEGINVRFGVA